MVLVHLMHSSHFFSVHHEKRPDKAIAKYIIYSISHTQEKVQHLFEQLGIAY